MDTPYEWIETAERLEALGRAMEQAAWIAIDTESNSMFVYRERVCLIQLNVEGALYLVDPLALTQGEAPWQAPHSALERLRAPLEDRDKPKLLHGGEYDVATLARDFGIALRGIFDSQHAAFLLGWERTGYGAVVERVTGVKLAKAHTQDDWGKRPIDKAALDYAIDDVRYLPEVSAHLKAAVTEADLEEELAVGLCAIEEKRWHGGFDPGAIWRMNGAHKLSGAQMRGLFVLHCLRDRLARRYDRPAGQFINDRVLVALATRRPEDTADLKRAGLRSALVAHHGEELMAALKNPERIDDLPPFPPRPCPREPDDEEKKREANLRAWRQKESKRRQVTPHAVLPTRALMWLKAHGADDLGAVPQLGEKRARLYGDELRRLCRQRK